MEDINNNTSISESFARDVKEGLNQYPKTLPSQYFYDEKGDQLFQDIMNMPTYYLTNCEFEILETHTKEICQLFKGDGSDFELIEFGAGDGKKTKLLLKYMVENQYNFVYKPIDISENVLEWLQNTLKEEIPKLTTIPEQGEYFEVLNDLSARSKKRKVIIVLGSNIGNLPHPKAIDFLKQVKQSMNTDDLLMMGFDQKKNPQTILDAYNDKDGITAEFNINLLRRINRELKANFDVSKFIHWETYNPETGTASSFLVATEPMDVNIVSLNKTYHFEEWETIHTEISQKYDDRVVKWLVEKAGLKLKTSFSDKRNYYKNYIFTSNNI